MKVIVTGGTGFVGREVVGQLRRAGHAVQWLTRATLADADAGVTARRGGDAVIHLAGIISEVGGQTFANVHVRVTERIVTAVQGAGGRRFLHLSALGTRANAPARYHQTKWTAEEMVRASGLDWTIFRPRSSTARATARESVRTDFKILARRAAPWRRPDEVSAGLGREHRPRAGCVARRAARRWKNL